MNKFDKKPSSTGVMELYARYKKTNLEDLMLNFAGIPEFKGKTSITKGNSYMLNTASLEKANEFNAYKLEVNDFNFKVFKQINYETNYAEVKDLTKSWMKMLLNFDKTFMFAEYSENIEFKKEQVLKNFYEKCKGIEQDNTMEQ